MIEKLDSVSDGIDAFRAVGTINRSDYEEVVVPVLDRAAAEAHRLRILCIVDAAFDHLAPDAIWEDLTVGMRALRMIDGCAVVSDLDRVSTATRLAAFLMPCPVRVFDVADRDRATAWLTELPDDAGFSIQLRPESGVAVVRVERALRASDIDALTATIERWCDTHHELSGLVVIAPAFPGWANLRSLIRHVTFVAGYQKRIRRVALAVDGFLGTQGPRLANLALHPEVRHFAHDQAAAAIEWAAASGVHQGGVRPAR